MRLSTLVGDRIRSLRKAKGWTQEQLAEGSSLYYSYVGGVERGERNISLETLGEIVMALQVPPMEFFRNELNTDDDAKAHRRALDEHMAMISSRSTEELEMINKLNRDIFNAKDSKAGQ
ncbi:helix-turn-helix domain-containing protein [Paenibacillus dokdonensis]|uniref:Helix-turn-helix domain-containing protein n=1 Tax=Paenibacillus dokdonensis TaxID=2567944 RepID=A0ABU6GV15_9BACL|nr:helix-turn-helix domain-containing protein [Paenibacillus dokdonensis]MEC0243589.1 helix-turn-helix domain-containing protein [Paenibacillus dokdonensis]